MEKRPPKKNTLASRLSRMTTNLIPSKNWGAVQKALAVFGASDVLSPEENTGKGGSS